jgi:hypothetical protein
MTKLVLTKGQDGKLCALDEKGQKAYAKFKGAVANLKPGETLAFNFRLPRSMKHHGLFFAKLSRLLERTETFTELDKLRAWVIMGAGYADFVPGTDGKPCAIPRSMDFDSMDEAEFSALHSDVDAFLWCQHAQAILWPSLTPERRWECMESFMGEFGQ